MSLSENANVYKMPSSDLGRHQIVSGSCSSMSREAAVLIAALVLGAFAGLTSGGEL